MSRPRIFALIVLAALPGYAAAQTTYTWNNAGTDWNTAANWSPNGTPGSSDTAQFVEPVGAATNPVLAASTTVQQLILQNAPATGWSLSGSGTLSSGINGSFVVGHGIPAITTGAGSGAFNINVGDGSSTSLSLSGNSTAIGGLLTVSSGSKLTLSGNTIALNTNSNTNSANPPTAAPVMIRGGTLVLDNSAGNPAGQRLTSNGGIQLVGQGSTLELRGAAGATDFSGFAGGGLGAGAGDVYLRTVPNGSSALSAEFSVISRFNPQTVLYFENIGSGLVGDAGKPTITAATAPTVREGVISSSSTTTTPWALVTNRASETPGATVTGRRATYGPSGVAAAATTNYTGDFGNAPVGTNVLFNPSVAGTVNQASSGNHLATVVFEPTVPGVTYNIGAGNQLNTFGVAVSGGNDITVTGGSLFPDDATSGTRYLSVLNPTTSLFTNSNLGNANGTQSSATLNISGQGFVILTGTSNQFAFAAPQDVRLDGSVLRVTTANFDPTNTILSFRGGTLEYDVSGGNAAFTMANNTSGGNSVNWCSSVSAGGSSDNGTYNMGGGGFSAYSTTPGNTLTVNLGGAGDQLNWSDYHFVSSNYALSFGSLKSNATVVFQNPLNLGPALTAPVGTSPSNREIEVTRGVGNAADKTQLTGVVSGGVGYDLVKTGTGILETTANNTYGGSTLIKGGELRISGANTGAGAYIVDSGILRATNSSGSATGTATVTVNAAGTLAGSGSISGNVNFLGGTLAPSSGVTTPATLAIGATNLSATSTLDYKLGTRGVIGSGVSDLTEVQGNLTLDGSLKVSALSGFGVGAYRLLDYTGTLTNNVLSIGQLPAGFAGSVIDTSHTGQVNLNVITILGDVNGDGVVNGLDISLVASNWLHVGFSPAGDGNFDSVVNGLDISLIASNWLHTYSGGSGQSAAAAVPEPATLSLSLSLFVLAPLLRRRRSCAT